MTDIISPCYLQGIFLANFGMTIFNVTVSEKELDTAKEAAEKLMEQYIDGCSLTKEEKERIKHERKTENEEMMRGLKDTLTQAGKLIG